MPKAGARGLAIVAILCLAILPGASQDSALTILTASPDGRELLLIGDEDTDLTRRTGRRRCRARPVARGQLR